MQYFDFRKESDGEPQMEDSRCGFLPDRADSQSVDGGESVRIGLFADMMPQSIITRIVAYRLNEVWLYGNESDTLIRNLRATIVPYICKDIIIKKCSTSNNSSTNA